MASINDLPAEVLEKVLLYLKPAERLKCATVCRRWDEQLREPRLLEDVQVVLDEMVDRASMDRFQYSERCYRSLRIVDATLDFNYKADFWARIGEELAELQLDQCDISARVFFNILAHCQRLESLQIKGCSSLMMSDSLLNPICEEELRKSLCNVRHLSLESTRYVTDASFHFLLDLMPNVSSLSLAGLAYLQFHPGLFQRFHNAGIEFSPSVLTFRNLLTCLMRSKNRFKSLDFSGTMLNLQALTQLVELYNDCLFELRLDRCDQLTDKAILSIANFEHLRLLSLRSTGQVTDAHIEAILGRTKQLEHLDLSGCFRLRDDSCLAISKSQKLKFLSLYSCSSISNKGLACLHSLSSLRHLDLSYSNVDAEVFRSLKSLGQLQSLNLTNCKRLDDECVQIICDHFKRLEKLTFEYCLLITDIGASQLCKLSNLREFALNGSVWVTDQSLVNGIGSPDMRSLKLALVNRLTDAALVSIAAHHRSLQLLDLSGCSEITDAGLRSLVEYVPFLRTLNLYGCRLLTDESLSTLGSNCRALHRLTVKHCNMTEKGICSFERQHPTTDVTY